MKEREREREREREHCGGLGVCWGTGSPPLSPSCSFGPVGVRTRGRPLADRPGSASTTRDQASTTNAGCVTQGHAAPGPKKWGRGTGSAEGMGSCGPVIQPWQSRLPQPPE